MILTAISSVLFGLQVLLLPVQIYSYLVLKIDKTRLRFLLIALSFTSFNAVWVLLNVLFQSNSKFSSFVLIYIGIALLSHFYYYITKELGLELKRFSVLNFTLLILFTELLRECSLYVVTPEFLALTSLFFFFVFQVIVMLFGVRLIRSIFQNDQNDRSPFENAAIGCIVTLMFLPLVLFHVEVKSLYNLLLNSVFLVIAFAYFKHFVIRLKLEKKMFPPQDNLGGNLQEQFVRIPDIFFEYDLSTKEREISIFLLKGMSYEEIATKIYRTAGAVRKQGSKAYAKAGVKNLQEFRKKFEYKNGKISPKWTRK